MTTSGLYWANEAPPRHIPWERAAYVIARWTGCHPRYAVTHLAEGLSHELDALDRFIENGDSTARDETLTRIKYIRKAALVWADHLESLKEID